MDVTCLGHAMWLVEANGLRILTDPLLDDLHHGGVFEVVPPRVLDVPALAPDFVLVSHRHPDHFDVASLARLAALDPETVVVTPDPLVAEAARAVGFSTVRELAANMQVDLDGVRLVTTPSAGAVDPEWGVIVDDCESSVWNQVDTDHALGTPVTLALVRWQPLLEVEAMLGERFGFPFDRYAAELARAKAIRASAVVPASAGVRHAAPYAAMNRLVYPVDEARFLRDLASMNVNAHPAITGTRFHLEGSAVTLAKSALVELRDVQDTREFRPFEIPPVVDPNPSNRPLDAMRGAVDRWVRDVLAPAVTPGLVHLLEVVLPETNGNISYTLHRGVAHQRRSDWDLRCVVAGSLLLDVVEGTRHWGDLLLGGALRAASRAYEIRPSGLAVKKVQPLFVYEAVSYEASVRRVLQTMYSRCQ